MNEEVEVTPTIQHPVLIAQNERIETLMKANEELSGEVAAYKNKDEYVSAQLTKWSDKYRKAEYALTDLLKELITDEDITIENAQRIADIFDNVLLTKRVSIRYDFVATVEVEVPFGKDPDEIADNLYCDRVTFETYDSDTEVLEVDFDVIDWNVTS
jgi:hypothetical protein